MALIQRPAKQGGSTEYQGKVAQGYTKILSAEMDADLDTIYAAWNGGVDPVNIKPNAVTNVTMAASSVDTRVLADNSVTSSKIVAGAVGPPQLDPSVYLWQVSGGTTLTPVDATKNVTVPLTANGDTYVSSIVGSAAKGRLSLSGPSTFRLSVNSSAATGTLLDDTTKPTWAIQFEPTSDHLVMYRAPATTGAPAWAALLTLDNTGKLTLPGPTATGTDQSAIGFGTRTTKGHLITLPSLDSIGLSINRYYDGAAWQRDDAAKDAWHLGMSSGGNVQIVYVSTAGSGLAYFNMDNAGNVGISGFTAGTTGNLTITGNNGQKNTGTVWINPSDIRLKHGVDSYQRGLADILKLDAITYRLNAQPDRECYGFDAAAVRDVFPECVGTTRMKLAPDDAEETDVLTFDMHPILVALINAIKELAGKRDDGRRHRG